MIFGFLRENLKTHGRWPWRSLRHEVARGELASRGGLADARDVATGLCLTCPRRDVRGRFLTGWVRSSRKSPRAVVPVVAATGAGKDRRATVREPLLMPRHTDIPGWVAVPGWVGTGRCEAAGGGRG